MPKPIPYQMKDFVAYARAKNIEVLADDAEFILDCIKDMPKTNAKGVLRDYLSEWMQGVGVEENPAKKQNAGRRRANLFMLKKFYSVTST